MVNVLPAAVIVPVRAAPVLAAARYSTRPLPLPDAPETIVSQLALAVAVHAQVVPLVTWMDPVVASEPTLLLAGAMSNVQGAGVGLGDGDGGAGAGGAGAGSVSAPACWMVTDCGPTVTVPVRAAAVVLRATDSVSVPERFPVGVGGTVIHGAWLAAVHAHPVSVSIVIATSPPPAETVAFVGATA